MVSLADPRGRPPVREPAQADRAQDPAGPETLRWARALPAGFVLAVAGFVAVAEGAALVGWHPLAHRGSSVAVTLGVLALAAAGGWWVTAPYPVPAGHAPPRPSARTVISLLPALVLVAYAVGARFLSPGARASWFLGGDHLRHVVYVAEEQGAGNLSYAEQTYPRGWHTLVATLWTAHGGAPDATGLRSLVELQSTLAWLLPVVLAVATAVLASALAARCGLGTSAVAMAGTVASAGVLVPSVLANYQALGFENSWVAAIAGAAAATELVTGRACVRSVIVCAASVVVVSHSWQLLLPGVGLCLVLAVWRVARTPRGGLVAVAEALGVALVAMLVSMPGLVSVVTQIGLGHAADSDVVAPIPRGLVVVAALSCVGLLLRVSPRGPLPALVVVVVLPAATALAVSAVIRIPVTDYYPSKLIWHTAVLGLAPSGVALVVAARGLRRRPGRLATWARGAGGAGAVVAGAYLALTPLGAFVGAWSKADGDHLLRVVTVPGAGTAQVVWVGSAVDDARARILLDFYRAGRTAERVPQEPLAVAAECDVLRRATVPAVLSDRSVEEVRARYACVPSVTVVRVHTVTR